MLRRLILVGALASATTGSALAAGMAPAGADNLQSAQHVCQNDDHGIWSYTGGNSYSCVWYIHNPFVGPRDKLEPAKNVCHHQFQGLFFDVSAPLVPVWYYTCDFIHVHP